jgi:hypothetical protein
VSEYIITLDSTGVKYIGLIFDKRVTWSLHLYMIAAKAFRTLIRVYSPFKSELLITDLNLTLHKPLISIFMTYACPVWMFAEDSHLLKLQRLQNEVLSTIGNFPKRRPVRELHMAFNLPYVYDYITKLYRHQAGVIQNHENANVSNIGQSEARYRNIRGLNLAAVKHTTVKVTRLPV